MWGAGKSLLKSSVSKCVSASVPASVHGQAMRTLVIHKINFGPNPQRRLSVPVLMMSSVLHSPNILHISSHTYTNTHHPARDHRSGSFSPLEREKRKRGKKRTCWYLHRMTKIKDCVMLLLAYTDILSLICWAVTTRGRLWRPVRAQQRPSNRNLTVRAAHVSTAAPGSLCCPAKRCSEND